MRSFLFLLLATVVGTMAAATFLREPVDAAKIVLATPKEYDPLQIRPSDEGDTGQIVYLRYCSGCHGVHGDGQGPGAPYLTPRPRDFTKGIYKFTSTPAGSPPLPEDLLRTITEGLHGTSMPAWRLIPQNERESVVRYVLAFHTEWELRTAEPAVPFHENPVDLSDRASIEAAIGKGRKIFHKQATCWSCHPAYMTRPELETLAGSARDDLEKPLAKPDAWGETILPPDFARDRLKSIKTLKDLYAVIAAGVGGTAMPTWKGALKPDELWSLVFYVDSLRPSPFSTTQATLKKLKEAEAK